MPAGWPDADTSVAKGVKMELAIVSAIILLIIYSWWLPTAIQRERRKHADVVNLLTKAHAEEIEATKVAFSDKIKHLNDCQQRIIATKDAKIDEVEKRATVFQERLSVLLPAQRYGVRREWERLLRIVDAQHHLHFAAMTKPHLEFNRDDPFSAKSCFEQHQVEMQRFQLSLMVGLSEHTPPELVAQQIAENVKQAVLQKWQAQSALLVGEK